jgi:Cu-Zn family superoxide dismutase
MKTTTLAWIVGIAVAGHGAALAKGEKATATLESRSDSKVTGKVYFTEHNGKVLMKVTVEGLTPGKHAIHLHEKGDCSAPDAASAGGHWNPTSELHGQWAHGSFHHGDIGNLVANAKGKAELNFATDQWTIGDGKPTDVVGHSVIVHAKEDDFTTQPTGNAGGRQACGVIVKTP